MNMYERIEFLRKKEGISQGNLEKELEFSNGSISKWKASTPKPERLQKLADYFGVSVDFLIGKADEIECKECGQKYNPLDEFDCAIHEQFHTKILKAKEKYKCLLPYNELASIRYSSLEKVRSGSEDIATELDKYLKAEFSHYVYMNYEESKHYDFFEFAKSKVVEMINNGDIPQEQIDNVVKWYKLDKEFINIQGATLARASKSPKLMRILAYAEKLSPKMLDMLEVQLEALVNKQNEFSDKKVMKFSTVEAAREYISGLQSFAAFNPHEISDDALISIANAMYESNNK